MGVFESRNSFDLHTTLRGTQCKVDRLLFFEVVRGKFIFWRFDSPSLKPWEFVICLIGSADTYSLAFIRHCTYCHWHLFSKAYVITSLTGSPRVFYLDSAPKILLCSGEGFKSGERFMIANGFLVWFSNNGRNFNSDGSGCGTPSCGIQTLSHSSRPYPRSVFPRKSSRTWTGISWTPIGVKLHSVDVVKALSALRSSKDTIRQRYAPINSRNADRHST